MLRDFVLLLLLLLLLLYSQIVLEWIASVNYIRPCSTVLGDIFGLSVPLPLPRLQYPQVFPV